jgi:hypothetical protein
MFPCGGGANNPGVSGKEIRDYKSGLENVHEDLIRREYVGIRVEMTSCIHRACRSWQSCCSVSQRKCPNRLDDADPGHRISKSRATEGGCLERPAKRDHDQIKISAPVEPAPLRGLRVH